MQIVLSKILDSVSVILCSTSVKDFVSRSEISLDAKVACPCTKGSSL
jgi:hypothetical protein